MTKTDIEKIIIAAIPSLSLKKTIEEKNYKFSEEELLAITYKYSPTFKRRLEILKFISENFSEKIQSWANDCIEYQKRLYDTFMESSDSYVFELHIIDTPGAHEERYLCKNYEAVLKEIEFFYKSYGGDYAERATDGDSSHKSYEVEKSCEAYISVVKRKVSDCKSEEDFIEDNFTECLLTRDIEIKEINIWSLENEKKRLGGVCMDCKDICINNFKVSYPSFVKNLDVVMYYELNEKKYSVALVNEDYALPYDNSTVYVLTLNSCEMKYKDYEEIEMTHEHIRSPFVEVVSFTDINKELQENYLNYKKYIKDKK